MFAAAIAVRLATRTARLAPGALASTRCLKSQTVRRSLSTTLVLRQDSAQQQRSSPPRDLLPLPEPPARGKSPSPVIAQDHVTTYLIPLYERGWRLASRKDMHVLTRRYTLPSFDHVMEFVNELASYAREDRHHPSISFDYNTVSLRLWTHEGVRLMDPGQPDAVPRLVQGITVRDIRIACRAEELYAAWIAERGAPSYADQVLDALGHRPILVQDIYDSGDADDMRIAATLQASEASSATSRQPERKRLEPRQSYVAAGKRLQRCFMCGGPHLSASCPNKDDVNAVRPPKRPCPMCGGSHWLMQCPQSDGPRWSSRERFDRR